MISSGTAPSPNDVRRLLAHASKFIPDDADQRFLSPISPRPFRSRRCDHGDAEAALSTNTQRLFARRVHAEMVNFVGSVEKRRCVKCLESPVSVWVSLHRWYLHRVSDRRYRAQAHAVSSWLTREARRALGSRLTPDQDRQLDYFHLFFARAVYRELSRHQGFCPISNAQVLSPTTLFAEAMRYARIAPTDPIIRCLPHVRIRIVPEWVKVYGIGTPHHAPITLYPDSFATQTRL
jgi:hypothetical protein